MNDNLCAKENSSQQRKSLKRCIKLFLKSTKEPTDKEKYFQRPNEKEINDLYCRWNHFLSELTKDSRIRLQKVEHAETTIQILKDKLVAMTLADFLHLICHHRRMVQS